MPSRPRRWSPTLQAQGAFPFGTVVTAGSARFALLPLGPRFEPDGRWAVDLATGDSIALYPRAGETLHVQTRRAASLRLVAEDGYVFAEVAPGRRGPHPLFDAFKILYPFESVATRPTFLAQARNYAEAWVLFATRPAAKANPERTQPDLVRHCVARVAEKLDGPPDARLRRAFAICTAQMQKSGRMRPGTRKLTPRGAAFERHKRAKPDHAARLDAYEELLDAARQARPPRRVRFDR